MFRIYLHSTRESEWLSLEGNLAGSGVGELERCWYTLAPNSKSPSLRLDVSRLHAADRSGEQLLSRMQRKGVALTGVRKEVSNLRHVCNK
ncbi:MAG: hypothetical protein ABJF23_07480 [Bryobacteraceae bacterium]